MRIVRTTNTNGDFKDLVNLLDSELAIYDGDEHQFYDQYNGIADIKHVVLLYYHDNAVACGAMKHHNESSMEIKRMYVREDERGKGYSSIVLNELESWARQLKYKSIVLETGKRQVSAVNLYRNRGYLTTKNYEPYVGVDNSICFKKVL